METTVCANIRAWLETGQLGPPRTELLDHILTCGFCQGSLALTVIAGQEAIHKLECAECQRRLPELIEALDGAWSLQGEHIGTLAHMLACADCRETYRLVSLIRAAEQVGMLRSPPRSRARRSEAQRISLLTLSRDFLNLMVPLSGNSTKVRGPEEHETVIAAAETSYGFSLKVSVNAEPAGAWAITVTLSPAPSGWVEVQLGQALFRAPLYTDGTAHLFGIPATLLSAPDGPGLAISLASPAEATSP